eukprot:g78.t1
MGLCGAKKTWEDPDFVDAKRKYLQKQANVIKILLLGAGESGKSTIFKQMQILHGKGFAGSSAMAYSDVIMRNFFKNMLTLVKGAEKLGVKVTATDELAQFLQLDMRRCDWSPKVTNLFKTLWADPGIKQVYAKRSILQVADSTAYYFDQIDRIAAPGYIPNNQDILRARIRTSGIVEDHFLIGENQNDFAFFDVGGQRNERKKWIHCFDDVTAVIFVAALSEYDQVLYEDRRQNRMVEAIQLFKEIVNCKFFSKTAMILFLNKADLFAEKIKAVDIRQPLDEKVIEVAVRNNELDLGKSIRHRKKKKVKHNGFFMDYNGGCNEEAGLQYFEKLFRKQNRNPKRQIFTHVTTATDTENIDKVFNSVRRTLLNEGMNDDFSGNQNF